MLPKSDVFILLRNDGPSMDKNDNQWSMTMHGDDDKCARIKDDPASADLRSYLDNFSRLHLIKFVCSFIWCCDTLFDGPNSCIFSPHILKSF
jgi:hypothetical protein